MASVTLHPEAEAEYDSGLAWYHAQSVRATNRFAGEVRRTLADIGAQPDRFAQYDADHREAPVTRYPYTVIYRVEPAGGVVVVAVAHASRAPGYWRGRA